MSASSKHVHEWMQKRKTRTNTRSVSLKARVILGVLLGVRLYGHSIKYSKSCTNRGLIAYKAVENTNRAWA